MTVPDFNFVVIVSNDVKLVIINLDIFPTF